MRTVLCTVSAPLASCKPIGISPSNSSRFVAVHLLNQQPLYFIVQLKSKIRELYHQTCTHFNQHGMLNTELFGLAFISEEDFLFADPDIKICKYAPKIWRTSHTQGLDVNGRPIVCFYFRVQFYVDTPLLLNDDTSRSQYYLQLKFNITNSKSLLLSLSPSPCLSDNEVQENKALSAVIVRLAALALQVDYGDFTSSSLYRPEDYVPPTMRSLALLRAIEDSYREFRGLTNYQACTMFLEEACKLDYFINGHIFRLKAFKMEKGLGSILLAICAKGLRVHPDNNPPSIFLWSSITKVCFEKKKFEIRTCHEKITLYTSSDYKSNLILQLCKSTHQFSMTVTTKLAELGKFTSHVPWEAQQRTSLVSTTSSNTTSGIISDKVQSEDEPEIMINSPPLINKLTSDVKDECTSSSIKQNSSNEDVKNNFTPSENDLFTFSQPNSRHTNTYHDSGSSNAQTSSVLTSYEKCQNSPTLITLLSHHAATTLPIFQSSCEEIYHSTVASSQTSGVYTLTSASTCPDLYHIGTNANTHNIPRSDSTEIFRNRTNSNASANESFHGDGSDPTENGRTLLSAAELSDLIVGHRYASNKILNTSEPDNITSVSSPYSFTTTPCYPTPHYSEPKSYQHHHSLDFSSTTLNFPCPSKGLSKYGLHNDLPAHCLLPCTRLTPFAIPTEQADQYRQQMCSDADFVFFPWKEPTISKQDYVDAKLSSTLSCKRAPIMTQGVRKYDGHTHQILRSSFTNLLHNPIDAPPRTLPRRSAPPPPPLPKYPSYSPPPPPPPPIPKKCTNISASESQSSSPLLDIRTLRERSKKLDLPLISALCNDKSLIKQTKAFMMLKSKSSSNSQLCNGNSTIVTASTASTNNSIDTVSTNRPQFLKKLSERSHRHPADQLPELPDHLSNANVMYRLSP